MPISDHPVVIGRSDRSVNLCTLVYVILAVAAASSALWFRGESNTVARLIRTVAYSVVSAAK
jgi:hypothetical protein